MLGLHGSGTASPSITPVLPPLLKGQGQGQGEGDHNKATEEDERTRHYFRDAECDMRCGGELVAPVHGRFGHFFNPALKPSPYAHLTKSHRKLLHTKSVWEIKARTRTNEFIQSLCPEQPAPYQGPYHNVMWDPHVRRGPAFVPFPDLENPCYIPDTRKRPFIKRKKNFFQLSLGKNSVKVKEELTDYSQFLEEQGEDTKVPTKEEESQTDEIALNRQELDERWGSESENRFRHNFATGMDTETQVDRFIISAEMRAPLNPNQETISRIGRAFKAQLLPQSLLEEMEALELAAIRAQCDQIEEWLAKDKLAVEKEERDLQKKLERIRKEEDMVGVEGGLAAEVRKRVEANIFANCDMKAVFSAACTGLERGGKLGTEFSSEKIDSLLGAAAIKKELDRRRAGREMLDEIIWEGVQRTKKRFSQTADAGPKYFHKSLNSPMNGDRDGDDESEGWSEADPEGGGWRKSSGEEGEKEEEDYDDQDQEAPGN